MFLVNGKTYEVQKAVLRAHFTDAAYESRRASNAKQYVLDRDYANRFCWFLEIEALEEKRANGIQKEIHLCNDGFSIQLSSWKDLAGQKLIWKSKYKMHNRQREYAGDLAFHDTASYHSTFEDRKPITSGTIEFLERKKVETEVKIKTRWSGFHGELPFLFEGDLDFRGISVHCDFICRYEKVREKMSEFIDMDEFGLYEFKVDSSTFERGDPWGSSGLFVPLESLH